MGIVHNREILSLIIGTLGVIPLSVHTIPTQVIMLTFMLPLSLGIALAVRLGATLPVSVLRAKQTVKDCLLLSVIVFGAFSVLMYTERYAIYGLFTSSPSVIAGCEEIWWHVSLYYFFLSMFGVKMGVCIGLGMQWILGVTTIVILWIFGLPAAYYIAIVQGAGLNGAWSTIWPPYVVINFILAVAFIRSDWHTIASDIRQREGTELDLDSLRGVKLSDSEQQRPFIDRYGSTRDATNLKMIVLSNES
jgi:MATE family multidrug resistance protein